MTSSVSISQTTKGKLPRLPFEHLKNEVLGKNYEISLVFAGNTRMRTLNHRYRGKNYIPNTLSFSLTERSGEIFINPHRISVEARKFDLSDRAYTALLFIHGLLHLKGMEHSARMEKKERELLRAFAIT